MEISLEQVCLNAKGAILKKINVSFIVYFYLNKYNFRVVTFSMHLIYIINTFYHLWP